MVVQQHRSGGGARAVCALAVVGVMAAAAGCSAGGGSGGVVGGRAVADERGGADSVDIVHRAAEVLAGADGRGENQPGGRAVAGSAEVRTSMETAAAWDAGDDHRPGHVRLP